MMFPVLQGILGPLDQQEVAQSRRFIRWGEVPTTLARLLHTFMVDGRPGREDWRPVTMDHLTHLVVGDQDMEVEEGLPFQDRHHIWDSLDFGSSNPSAEQGNKVKNTEL